ncbi:MAG: diaminopimelate epimerase [Acidobacteriota bacterium]
MKIPFTKAHGALNDFLLTWQPDLAPVKSLSHLATAICHRNAGVGADGWLLISPAEAGCDVRIRLFNPDGGEVEMSGNGTRCAAAWALANGHATAPTVRILTGAGPKSMSLVEQSGPLYSFVMDMGLPSYSKEDLHAKLQVGGHDLDCTILHVGNPQCAIFVADFDFDWISLGAAVERDPRFPDRTNVSFVRVLDSHSIDVRFFERGVGVTNSSGTGSTGAMAASVLRGLTSSPVTVHTPAGILKLSWDSTIHLLGPAELVATGLFNYSES